MIKDEHIILACLLSPVQVSCHHLRAQQAEVKRLSCLIYAECTYTVIIFHSCGAGLPKSVCVKKYRNSNTVTDKNRDSIVLKLSLR